MSHDSKCISGLCVLTSFETLQNKIKKCTINEELVY